jgi:hypothetical protein
MPASFPQESVDGYLQSLELQGPGPRGVLRAPRDARLELATMATADHSAHPDFLQEPINDPAQFTPGDEIRPA